MTKCRMKVRYVNGSRVRKVSGGILYCEDGSTYSKEQLKKGSK